MIASDYNTHHEPTFDSRYVSSVHPPLLERSNHSAMETKSQTTPTPTRPVREVHSPQEPQPHVSQQQTQPQQPSPMGPNLVVSPSPTPPASAGMILSTPTTPHPPSSWQGTTTNTASYFAETTSTWASHRDPMPSDMPSFAPPPPFYYPPGSLPPSDLSSPNGLFSDSAATYPSPYFKSAWKRSSAAEDVTSDRRFHPRHHSANALTTGESIMRPYFFSSPPPVMPSSFSEAPESTTTSEQTLFNAQMRFNIILQAPTAAAQRAEDSPLTYLNRGQPYGIQLRDRLACSGNITSTFIIMFHDPSHRKVALNYWKFWIGQQDSPQEARAIDLDSNQSVGICNVQFPSFDRITFDWNGRQGAKIYVRFNCLSTDFSRIKGVKGIPLRAYMESKATCSTSDLPMLHQYIGSVQVPGIHGGTSPSINGINSSTKPASGDRYVEKCYCKVKLFRDKGAERKNKDDAKQISKQLEKIMAEGNPRQHPLWHMYNQPVMPYSVFGEVPSSPSSALNDFKMPSDPGTTDSKPPTPGFSSGFSTIQSPAMYDPIHIPPYYAQPTPFLPAHPSALMPSPPAWTAGVKRSERDEGSPIELAVPPKRMHQTASSSALRLFVDVRSGQPRRGSANTSSPNNAKDYQRIDLESLTVKDLIIKMCSTLSLHPTQVSEVLWRRESKSKPKSNEDVLILVEDSVIAQHFHNNAVISVEWEIKADGTVRLLLQF